MELSSFYTLPEMALLMQVSVRHARRLVRDNIIPQPVRLGKCVRWPKTQIDAWVRNGCPTIGDCIVIHGTQAKKEGR